MKNKYKRVSCDFYDLLEIYALRKTKVQIKYANGLKLLTIQTFIKTLQTKDGIEYLITQEDTTIRLDHILDLKTI